ncbi:hypothetical protein ACJX0J_023203, partial [Zea mays]
AHVRQPVEQAEIWHPRVIQGNLCDTEEQTNIMAKEIALLGPLYCIGKNFAEVTKQNSTRILFEIWDLKILGFTKTLLLGIFLALQGIKIFCAFLLTVIHIYLHPWISCCIGHCYFVIIIDEAHNLYFALCHSTIVKAQKGDLGIYLLAYGVNFRFEGNIHNIIHKSTIYLLTLPFPINKLNIKNKNILYLKFQKAESDGNLQGEQPYFEIGDSIWI